MPVVQFEYDCFYLREELPVEQHEPDGVELVTEWLTQLGHASWEVFSMPSKPEISPITSDFDGDILGYEVRLRCWARRRLLGHPYRG